MSRTYRERGPYADDTWKGHSDGYYWKKNFNWYCRRSIRLQRKRFRIEFQKCIDFDNFSFDDKERNTIRPDWIYHYEKA